MHRIELTQEIEAPRQAVWDLYTDHAGWERWAGVKEVVLRQQGDPPPNGLGAIRVIRQAGLAIEEEVTGFDAPKRMTYRLTAGAPVRDYQGEVRFDETESGGTRVTWTVSFRPWIPGTGGLVRRALERTLGDVLARLARQPFPAA
jgi:uncharacterized protein YndB with AHSA1/START domain